MFFSLRITWIYTIRYYRGHSFSIVCNLMMFSKFQWLRSKGLSLNSQEFKGQGQYQAVTSCIPGNPYFTLGCYIFMGWVCKKINGCNLCNNGDWWYSLHFISFFCDQGPRVNGWIFGEQIIISLCSSQLPGVAISPGWFFITRQLLVPPIWYIYLHKLHYK